MGSKEGNGDLGGLLWSAFASCVLTPSLRRNDDGVSCRGSRCWVLSTTTLDESSLPSTSSIWPGVDFFAFAIRGGEWILACLLFLKLASDVCRWAHRFAETKRKVALPCVPLSIHEFLEGTQGLAGGIAPCIGQGFGGVLNDPSAFCPAV